jgi:two-component system sensor histidine kinase KdpD
MTSSEPSDQDQRPSPEALLETATAEGRGRLKLFLGAAPGVGKTYEMLGSALRRKQDGVDVVIGVVETHGRVETERLLRGLEPVPRRRIDYKGRILEEMDLDAVLARKPQLVLVDELAHTNAPGSRHPKRYLDVEELLAAGIDVFTALNIQHLESLNDVIAKITRIRVRETVPDSIIDRADEIEVVDLTPEELIQRLREGKVYVRDQAQRALKHYFSPGNLTALRELALRRTAERVDEQMLSYMRAHAISGPWAAGERVLVCVSESPLSGQLVRHARRVADRLKATWVALYVETPRHHHLTETERDRVADALRLAERLGGQAVTVPGHRVSDDAIAYARSNNITQIILGRSRRSRWFEMLHGSIVQDVIRKAGSIGVQVAAGEGEALPEKTVRTRPAGEPFDPLPYLVATGLVAAATGIGMTIQQAVELANISLIFLAAILFTAVRDGLAPSLYASLLSTLAYNFFFIPPLYTFTIADPANVLALVFFTVVAVLTSNLTARTRQQALTAQRQIKTTAELNAFSRKLAGIGNLDDLLWAASFQIASMLKVRVIFLFPSEGKMAVAAGYPPEDIADEADLAAARWCWDHKSPAGRGSDTLPGAKRLFLPLRTGSGVIGVVGLDRDATGPLFTPDERRLLDALLDQTAVSVERIQLVDDIDEARVLAETERLRAALLTSISHDLRTPLASIIGSITSLRRYARHYDEAARSELMATIQDEAERLNRFVGNLLDMTRLEAGSLQVKADRIDLAEVVETAMRRAARILSRHRVEVALVPGLPMLYLDAVLFEQVLFNLLDNAAKHAPEGSLITITADRLENKVRIRVLDEGEGIPPEELEAIFDKFHRVRAGDQRQAGTGLGLAICRGFVEAFGGRIAAANRTDRSGAVFTILLPAVSDDPAPARPTSER